MGISGKHNPDNVLLGIHTTPEMKALAAFIAEKTNRSITDVILDGIMSEGTRAGIISDGKVLPEFKDQIIIKAGIVRANKKERQAKHA